MAKKLAIVVLLILYSLTGSVVAFAAHDHCEHGQTTAVVTPAPLMAVALAPAHDDHSQADHAESSCDGLCHVMTVADLHTDADLDLNRQHGIALVRAPAARWAALTLHVPTPPPNVVPRLS